MTMRSIDISDPQNTDKSGYGGQELRDLKSDIKDRMEIDHYWGNNLTETDADADGRHAKVTLAKLDSSPDHIANTGVIYTKVINDITELFYTDSDGNDVQMTDNGSESITTLIVGLGSTSSPTYYPDSALDGGEYVLYSAEVVVDINEDWDSVNNKVDVSTDGTYKIDVSLGEISTYSDYSRVYTRIYKNGVKVYESNYRHIFTTITNNTDDVDTYSANFVSGDEVDIRIYVTHGSSSARLLYNRDNMSFSMRRTGL